MKSARKHYDLIYDVGMHKGEDTEFYLSKGFKVVGFEADPDLTQYNRGNRHHRGQPSKKARKLPLPPWR